MMKYEPPAHKQTDPDKKPGQIINRNFDMMDDMAMIRKPKDPDDKRLEDYIRRLTDRL